VTIAATPTTCRPFDLDQSAAALRERMHPVEDFAMRAIAMGRLSSVHREILPIVQDFNLI
jgi:hypothetical protein